ncbi:hypothetical protein [Streptomyces tubercidicus]|uniref:Secreted protein n=1 Tax=Streptomyces tubercidicus TaxID=47759 RepID=A0A640UWC2_9ACTN|nr:hypothetical protein [Streptomyces tubercidicus]WAU14112.1 hypothetical protein STRTU_004691 [Streptomyces tubercidicus]GFE39807.1 hypothetical protein Stube_44800 [Streptomyces tubercidicus]
MSTSSVSPPAVRRTAWAEGLDELRAAATTEPGRLRVIGAVLALLVVLFGAVTAWQVSNRAAAADDVVEHSQPLTADAANLYRSLADADTTAAAGFLAGGEESRATRERYTADIATASALLVKASANSAGSDGAGAQITKLNGGLPRYTGLVETARANNRQGLPLGGAYLRYAHERMRTELLPAARALYDAETERLAADYATAKAWPWWALAAGVVALGALGWAQRRNYRRTHRVFNRGLLAATAACLVLLGWLVAGHTVARGGLTGSYEHGARSLRVLNEARIAALRARGDENLTLVARGAVLTGGQQDFYEAGFRSGMTELAGAGDQGAAAARSRLGAALALADDEAGRAPVRAALTQVREWQARHAEARAADDGGDFDRALATVIGAKGSTGESFDRVAAGLQRALVHEQGEFRSAADGGRAALDGLPVGAGVLAGLGALGAVLGIGRRLAEYR